MGNARQKTFLFFKEFFPYTHHQVNVMTSVVLNILMEDECDKIKLKLRQSLQSIIILVKGGEVLGNIE